MIGGILIGAGLFAITIPLGIGMGKYLSKISNSYPSPTTDQDLDYLEFLIRKHRETNSTTDSQEN